MCTVTFIPFEGNVFITSNRDESPGRQSTGIRSVHTEKWNAIHFPLDEESGGSWIALADRGRAICLLNGGYEPFIPSPPYRLSRGQVVLAAASAGDALQFLHEYELEGIAPFTLLIYEWERLLQMVWDGESRHINNMPADLPQIWSSVTLYPPHVRAWRKSLFENWVEKTNYYDRESIITFHQMANGDPDNDFIMNRNEVVKTLSITSITLKEKSGSMLYLDLEQQQREELLIQYDR